MSFYLSMEWRVLRYKALIHYGRKCMLCNATNKELHVDHIKPISHFPELKLDFNNLQILCKDCNLGKSNKDISDFRPEEAKNKTPPASPKIIKIPAHTNQIRFLARKKIQHVYKGSNTLCKLFNNSGIRQNYTLIDNPDNSLKFCKVCLSLWKRS